MTLEGRAPVSRLGARCAVGEIWAGSISKGIGGHALIFPKCARQRGQVGAAVAGTSADLHPCTHTHYYTLSYLPTYLLRVIYFQFL